MWRRGEWGVLKYTNSLQPAAYSCSLIGGCPRQNSKGMESGGIRKDVVTCWILNDTSTEEPSSVDVSFKILQHRTNKHRIQPLRLKDTNA